MSTAETRVREQIHMRSNQEIRFALRRFFRMYLSYKRELESANNTINDLRATYKPEFEYQELSPDQQSMLEILLMSESQERETRRKQFDIAKALELLVKGLEERYVVFDEELEAYRQGTEKNFRDARKLFMG